MRAVLCLPTEVTLAAAAKASYDKRRRGKTNWIELGKNELSDF